MAQIHSHCDGGVSLSGPLGEKVGYPWARGIGLVTTKSGKSQCVRAELGLTGQRNWEKEPGTGEKFWRKTGIEVSGDEEYEKTV